VYLQVHPSTVHLSAVLKCASVRFQRHLSIDIIICHENSNSARFEAFAVAYFVFSSRSSVSLSCVRLLALIAGSNVLSVPSS